MACFLPNHFEVTNIGANHDLMQLFEEVVPEPDAILDIEKTARGAL